VAGYNDERWKASDVIRTWGQVLKGHQPALSIEITKECPLRCPGCYAYEDAHLGGEVTLRSLTDSKGQDLIDRVLALVDRERPIHLSLVGGDPLVRYREVETLVPLLLARGIHLQIVTSAFRQLPASWADLARLTVCVSIDGLQPEHDVRRTPATYDRILRNIAGQNITVHCTITGQMMKRPGYLREFLEFWTPRPEIRRVWFSLFTPQIGEELPEILTADERRRALEDLRVLRLEFPKVDIGEGTLREFSTPPASPDKCMFAQLTNTLSADLKTRVTPCQFGGNPDCSSCGCIASMGMSAVASHKVFGVMPIGVVLNASIKVGRVMASRSRSD